LWKTLDLSRENSFINTQGHTHNHTNAPSPQGEQKMPVQIHGKDYLTVAERIQLLHEKYLNGGISIETEIVQYDESLALVRATLSLATGERYTGHAFERSDSGGVNSTSHLENAETSAVGRALSFAGFAGSEIASADEVASAIGARATQEKKAKPKPKPKPVYTDDAPAGPLADRLVKKTPDEKAPQPNGDPFQFESGLDRPPEEATDKQLWKLRAELRKAKAPSSPCFQLVQDGRWPSKAQVSAEIDAIMAGEPQPDLESSNEDWDADSGDGLPF
jgi:hypothetical protein